MDHYNRMCPFPPYDTDSVQELKEVITEMSKNIEVIDYDALPVTACEFCLSLFITDEVENDKSYSLCNKCYSINTVKEFSNINEYNEYRKDEGYEDIK